MVQLVQPCLAKDIQRYFACKYSLELLELCKLGAMHSWGSLGRGSICDSGISASEAALGVGELGEPLRTVCSSCLHVVTAMNLWQFVDTCRISVWLEGGKSDL